MRTLFCFIAMALTMASCEIETVQPVDIREREGQTMATAPEDWAYHPPADSIPVDTTPVDTSGLPIDTAGSDSIILPTCDEYEVVKKPDFLTGVLQFDLLPMSDAWYYDCILFPSLDSLLTWLGHPYIIYQSGINLAVIVDSTADITLYQYNIWAIDGGGGFNHMSFGNRHCNYLGALTYEEAWEAFMARPSTRLFSFFNTAWTCDEYYSFIIWLAEHCIDGSGKIFDIRYIPCDIPAELMEYLDDADFEIWD